MTEKEKLHYIVYSVHHTQSANRAYIVTKMLNTYGVTETRTLTLIDAGIQKDELLPDNKDGFTSIYDPMFDTPSKDISFGRINWTTLLTAIGVSIAALTFYLDKCQVNQRQQKNNTQQQHNDTGKQTPNHVVK